MGCGADTTAQELYNKLTTDAQFNVPDIDFSDAEFQIPEQTGDLYDKVTALTTEDLTTRKVDGSGTFDALMESINAHLRSEYETGRITGRDFTEAYIQNTQAALGTATQFLLGKDQAYWQAVMVQLQARTAEIEAVTARVALKEAMLKYMQTKFLTQTAVVDFALKKMQLAIADAEYCIKLEEKLIVEQDRITKEYTNTNILPAQYVGLGYDNDLKKYNLDEIMPLQAEMLGYQMEGVKADTEGKRFNIDYVLPKQLILVGEQAEAQRAQTSDTRSDGSSVVGLLGKQKDLYNQQIISYQRDSEVKAAKIFTDAWITQKTIDEGLLAPYGFTNSSLDTILSALKANNNLN